MVIFNSNNPMFRDIDLKKSSSTKPEVVEREVAKIQELSDDKLREYCARIGGDAIPDFYSVNGKQEVKVPLNEDGTVNYNAIFTNAGDNDLTFKFCSADKNPKNYVEMTQIISVPDSVYKKENKVNPTPHNNYAVRFDYCHEATKKPNKNPPVRENCLVSSGFSYSSYRENGKPIPGMFGVSFKDDDLVTVDVSGDSTPSKTEKISTEPKK